MCDVHYNLCVCNRRTLISRTSEVKQIPDNGERNHDCSVLHDELLSDAINSIHLPTLC